MSEFTIYQNGNTHGNVGTQVWPAPTDPGVDTYSYTVYLEQGNYMKWFLVFDPPGPFTGDSWMALQGLYIDTGGAVLQRHP